MNRLVPFLMAVLTGALMAQQQAPAPTVVFVCEHGAAKSVITTAWKTRDTPLSGMRSSGT